MQYIFWYDWLITIFFIFFIFLWSNKYVSKHNKDKLLVQYFKKGLWLKIIGSIAFACYHAYIYGGGDTFQYFFIGKDISELFLKNPTKFLKLVFGSIDSIQIEIKSLSWTIADENWFISSNYFTGRIAAVFCLFTFSTYLPTTILFSLGSYWGVWKCFKIFNRIFPENKKELSFAFLYFPTILFWGSGLGKDSICLASICFFTTAVYEIFIFKESIIKNTIIIIFSGLVLLTVKPYIIISFLPVLLISVSLKQINTLKNVFYKIIIFPLILGLLIIAGFSMQYYINENFNNFAIENLTEKIVSSNINLQVGAGSAYDLGIKPEEIHGLNDLLIFFPKGVIASWFRPWVWEAKNPAMLLSSIEGLFVLILVIIILIKGVIIKPFKIIFSNPILLSCLLYAFIFSGLVGLSTSNFGTLVRYKLPCMPFLILTLLITKSKLTKSISQQIV